MKAKRLVAAALMAAISMALAACGAAPREEEEFTTSGSESADQRAEQRVARAQEMRGEPGGETAEPAARTLYDRLGGEAGITAIVEDFTPRVINDPRVNFNRSGITRWGLNIGRGNNSVEWEASPQNVERFKRHMVQFITLATGGPAQYEGRDVREVHRGMKITNAEFDASVGDLKATLDALGVPAAEQKELLAIVETTRPQIVEER